MKDHRIDGVELERDTMYCLLVALKKLHADPSVTARHPDGNIAAIRFTRPDRIYRDTVQIAEDANGARSLRLLDSDGEGGQPAVHFTETFPLQEYLDAIVRNYRWQTRQDL